MTAPRRTCVGCRAVRGQAELIRVVHGVGGLRVAPRRWQGRSAYVCPSPGCLDRALARRAFARALRVEGAAIDPAVLRREIAAQIQEAAAVTGGCPAGRRAANAARPGGV